MLTALGTPVSLAVIISYVVAGCLPRLLPSAHGEHCRLSTSICCAASTMCLVGPLYGMMAATFLYWLPERCLWWPDVAESYVRICEDVMAWLEANDYVLPKEHKNPNDDQREEYLLARKYRKLKRREDTWSQEVRRLVDRIEELQSNPADVNTCRQLLQWLRDHDNIFPKQHRQPKNIDEIEENKLADRRRKLVAKPDSEKPPHIQKLLGEITALARTAYFVSPTKTRVASSQQSMAATKKAMSQRAQILVADQVQEHATWCIVHGFDPESEGQPEPQKHQPYPGLINLGNTCYLGAVVQCLLHSGPVRTRLLSLTNAAADGAAVALFKADLQSLSDAMVNGVSVADHEERVKFDTYSPHSLLDGFLALRSQEKRPLRLGGQHDALEALEEVLTQTQLGNTLFNVGSEHRPDIVALPPFEEDGWWYGKFTTLANMIDMKGLLKDGFQYLADRLATPSPMLAVVVPPFAFHHADGPSQWLEKSLHADWGDGVLDLVEYFPADTDGRMDAKYQLVAHVEYVGVEGVIPTLGFTEGHFRSHFAEAGVWYMADDSVVSQQGGPGQQPDVFP